MRKGSRLETRRWHASTSRATSSIRSGTTPSLHARHNIPHEALICACVLRLRSSPDLLGASVRRSKKKRPGGRCHELGGRPVGAEEAGSLSMLKVEEGST